MHTTLDTKQHIHHHHDTTTPSRTPSHNSPFMSLVQLWHLPGVPKTSPPITRCACSSTRRGTWTILATHGFESVMLPFRHLWAGWGHFHSTFAQHIHTFLCHSGTSTASLCLASHVHFHSVYGCPCRQDQMHLRSWQSAWVALIPFPVSSCARCRLNSSSSNNVCHSGSRCCIR